MQFSSSINYMNLLIFISGILLVTNLSYNNPTVGRQLAPLGIAPVSVVQGTLKVPCTTEDSIPPRKGTAKIKALTVSKKKNKERSNIANKKKNSPALSSEEALKILAKTDDITTQNRRHPNSNNNCQMAFDVTDEFTGLRKRGLAPRPFFSYSPEQYRKFVKEGDFIRCEGYLSQSTGGRMALNINLYIANKEAQYKFGGIPAKSSMVLHPMKGKDFFFITYKGATPQLVDNMTLYQCSFAIDKSDLKKLKKTEIDSVRIAFQEGVQTFDVFYLDFIIDQFPCFE